MKKRNVKVHLLYLLCIGVLCIVGAALTVSMEGRRERIQAQISEIEANDRRQLVNAIEKAEGALRTAACTESPPIYVGKMQQLAEGCAGAELLTEKLSPSSPWRMFWGKLKEFASVQAERTAANAAADKTFSADRILLNGYADILMKLKEQPEALSGPLWEDLPVSLSMPRFQTAFTVGEEQLKVRAAHVLGIRGGLLKKEETDMPGTARYGCANAQIDLLLSGKLVYLHLQLPQKEGHIEQAEGIQKLIDFAQREGYGITEVTDLYESNGLLWARLAPVVSVSPFGKIKNLDCPLLTACTLWSGRVCHFEVQAYEMNPDSDAIDGEAVLEGDYGTGSEKPMPYGGTLLSEHKLNKMAEARNALLGDTVICKGRICRTLLFNESNREGTVHLYLDAFDGSEKALELRHLPKTSELSEPPFSAAQPAADDKAAQGYPQLPLLRCFAAVLRFGSPN